MKFCEAMDALKNGQKVTRTPWKDGVYFKMEDKDVKSYQPILKNYLYTEDIMVSDGWIVEGKDDEFKFCDIIPLLQQGLKAKLKDWKESFIFLDKPTKCLILKSMEAFPFIPDFESFTAEDWIILEKKEEE